MKLKTWDDLPVGTLLKKGGKAYSYLKLGNKKHYLPLPPEGRTYVKTNEGMHGGVSFYKDVWLVSFIPPELFL